MPRTPTAFWDARENAWRSDTLTPGGSRRTRYIRGLPPGEKGSEAWQAAQAALAELLSRKRHADPPGPAYNPRSRPAPDEPDDFGKEVDAGPTHGDPPPEAIRAGLEPFRHKRDGRMADARAENDHPRSIQPTRPLRRPAPPTLTAADACAEMLQEWRQRAGRTA